MRRPIREGFLCRFGLKTGIRFDPFWSGIEYGFEGTMGVYECIYSFNSKMDSNNFFVCAQIYDNTTSA